MPTDHDMVRAFHQKMGLPLRDRPARDTDWNEAARKYIHLDEELLELRSALADQDLPATADALVDLCYVLHGMAAQLGLPWEALFREVHHTNMRKVGAGDDGSHKFGVTKPEGWRPPAIEGILRSAGWFGQ